MVVYLREGEYEMQKTTVVRAIILGALAGYGGSFANAGHNGKPGATGPVGITGKVGPRGKPAPIDLGLCYNVIYDPTGAWVTEVTMQPPWLADGVRSCSTGYFVSVVPAS